MAGTGSCKWFSCVHSWWVDACKQIASSSSRLYIRFLGELVNGNMNELNNSHVNLEFSTSSSLKKLYHLQHEFPFGSVDFNFLSKCVFRTIKHLRDITPSIVCIQITKVGRISIGLWFWCGWNSSYFFIRMKHTRKKKLN